MTPLDLLGEWAFDRIIDDRLTGSRMPVVGTAVFTVGPDGVDWVETGTLDGPTGPVPVAQTRRIVADESGWRVEFADGRPFHPWQVDEPLVHDCAPDLYRGRVADTSLGADADSAAGRGASWTMRWAATGPAKDYVVDTRYVRVISA